MDERATGLTSSGRSRAVPTLTGREPGHKAGSTAITEVGPMRQSGRVLKAAP